MIVPGRPSATALVTGSFWRRYTRSLFPSAVNIERCANQLCQIPFGVNTGDLAFQPRQTAVTGTLRTRFLASIYAISLPLSRQYTRMPQSTLSKALLASQRVILLINLVRRLSDGGQTLTQTPIRASVLASTYEIPMVNVARRRSPLSTWSDAGRHGRESTSGSPGTQEDSAVSFPPAPRRLRKEILSCSISLSSMSLMRFRRLAIVARMEF